MTCQHIDFVSVTVISCICKTNTRLVVIFQGESRCKSPSSWPTPWLETDMSLDLLKACQWISLKSLPKSRLKSRLKTHDLRPLVNTAPGPWSSLVQVMAWCLFGTNPLPETMVTEPWGIKSVQILNQNAVIFSQENALKNAVLPRPQNIQFYLTL